MEVCEEQDAACSIGSSMYEDDNTLVELEAEAERLGTQWTAILDHWFESARVCYTTQQFTQMLYQQNKHITFQPTKQRHVQSNENEHKSNIGMHHK